MTINTNRDEQKPIVAVAGRHGTNAASKDKSYASAEMFYHFNIVS